MARNPYVARTPIGNRAEVRRIPIKSGETFHAGELLKNTSNEAQVCGADPTVVMGIACDGAADVVESGYVNYYVADQDTVWAIEGSTDPVFATHFGNSYGVAVSNNVWTLDISETTTLVFTVVGTIENVTPKLFLVKFHADALS